jgi:hypothetical protein
VHGDHDVAPGEDVELAPEEVVVRPIVRLDCLDGQVDPGLVSDETRAPELLEDPVRRLGRDVEAGDDAPEAVAVATVDVDPQELPALQPGNEGRRDGDIAVAPGGVVQAAGDRRGIRPGGWRLPFRGIRLACSRRGRAPSRRATGRRAREPRQRIDSRSAATMATMAIAYSKTRIERSSRSVVVGSAGTRDCSVITGGLERNVLPPGLAVGVPGAVPLVEVSRRLRAGRLRRSATLVTALLHGLIRPR